MGNFYDDLKIDIKRAHEEIDEGKIKYSRIENYLSPIDKFFYKKGYYQRLIDPGLKQTWFTEFSEYWSKALHGRPLKFHDFFFLYSNYRLKFQKVEVDSNATAQGFLHAWQQYENIYLTFGSAYRYALNPYWYLPYFSYLKKAKGKHILEYGCGAAPPLVMSMIKSKLKQYEFTVADIKGFTYHFAKFRLKQHSNIRFINLEPYTVLEHLPNPLEVIETLTSSISKEDILFLTIS